MIQTRNQYLQFMLVMLAAWGISWGARFVMEQAVLLYGSGKNYLFFSHGTVLMYLLCVFLVYRVFRSRYCWTMWLGALITSLLFVAAHSQYQNLLTLAELFLVGLITSVARIRSGGLLLPVLLHMEATTLGLLFG
ncbi:hypothetical protein BU68_20430 [Escherichia coli]|uniref:CPBP family glutamic-type intramembrane protease n=1 Tax=Escherichia coli TaxID=562 RepID=UPI0004A0091C|nr:CPBP family glutamic-type intramembrane protease [Escherichia coli]EYB50324.1 hypothetical protein BU68_20430 [Escherichia coli]